MKKQNFWNNIYELNIFKIVIYELILLPTVSLCNGCYETSCYEPEFMKHGGFGQHRHEPILRAILIGPLKQETVRVPYCLEKEKDWAKLLHSNYIFIVFGIYLGSKQQLKPLNNKFIHIRDSPAIYRMSIHWIYGLFHCSKCASCENILCVSLVVFDGSNCKTLWFVAGDK